MNTIKPSAGTDCAINDTCDLDVRCPNFQQCVVIETDFLGDIENWNPTGFDSVTISGPDIKYDNDPAAYGTISLTTKQFEDFTKEHNVTWVEQLPDGVMQLNGTFTGVEPELQPQRLNIGSLRVELAEM